MNNFGPLLSAYFFEKLFQFLVHLTQSSLFAIAYRKIFYYFIYLFIISCILTLSLFRQKVSVWFHVLIINLLQIYELYLTQYFLFVPAKQAMAQLVH